MTGDETGALYTYDAWGRLISVDIDADASKDATYAYDALFRKIEVDEVEGAGGEKVWYYSQNWQVLETREESTGDIEEQFIWSPVYVDAMILRDRDTDNDGDTQDAGGSERLYVTHDANFNITAVADATGTIVERYMYDPYGQRTVLDANWAADADNTTDVAFWHGHQGGRHDTAGAGLVNFRFRELGTSLGRWTRQDPAGYIDGLSMYQNVESSPISSLDPTGLQAMEANAEEVGERPSREHHRGDSQFRASEICSAASAFDKAERMTGWKFWDTNCARQAELLRKHLGRQFPNDEYWYFIEVEGTWWANPISFHNVVIVMPTDINPQRPFTIDIWSGFLVVPWGKWRDHWKRPYDETQRERYDDADKADRDRQ